MQGESIRKAYISKLLLKNELKLVDTHKYFNTIIILDWDDTLCPTSYFSPNGVLEERDLTENEVNLFLELESTVHRLMNAVKNRGDIHIISIIIKAGFITQPRNSIQIRLKGY